MPCNRFAASILAVVLAIGVSGCGASGVAQVSSSLSSASSALVGAASKAAFIARADAVCRAANTALAPVKKVNGSTSDAVAQKLLRNASGVFAVAVRQLDALAAPPSLKAAWRAYVSDARREEAAINGMADAIGAGDATKLEHDAKRSEQLSKQARAALAGKGFSHCGTGH